MSERERERRVYTYRQVIDHGGAPRVADLFSTYRVWTSAGSAREEHWANAVAFQVGWNNTGRISRHVRLPEGWQFNTRGVVTGFQQQGARLDVR